MKKFLAFAVVSSLVSFAVAQDRLDGCGLGWQVNSGKTYSATTTRGTTNSFIPPTFGMTTGTMGCDKLEIGANDKAAADYVATNFESLKNELSKGQGEYVSALANVMGCQNSSAQLGQTLQQNYDQVVAPAQNAADLYKNIRTQAKNVCI